MGNALLDRYDTNHDGALTADELEEVEDIAGGVVTTVAGPLWGQLAEAIAAVAVGLFTAKGAKKALARKRAPSVVSEV